MIKDLFTVSYCKCRWKWISLNMDILKNENFHVLPPVENFKKWKLSQGGVHVDFFIKKMNIHFQRHLQYRKIYFVSPSEFNFFRTFHFRTQFFSNWKPLVIQIISTNVPNDKKHKILLITPSELVFRNIIFRDIKFSKY